MNSNMKISNLLILEYTAFIYDVINLISKKNVIYQQLNQHISILLH